MHPKISIITISYNSEKTIEETLQSVKSQNYDNLEYIIIDGGSSDGTLEIVNRYKDIVSKVISEKDEGISDAFNKGIKIATGKIIGILNSDDILLPNALNNISENYDESIDIYRGIMIIWDVNTNTEFKEYPSMSFKMPPTHLHCCHPSSFIAAKAYKKFGLYDTSLKYHMDLDWFLRAYQKGAVMKYIDSELAKFRLGGVTANTDLAKAQDRRIMMKNNNASFLQYIYYECYIIIRVIVKQICNLISPTFRLKLRYRKRGIK